MSKTRRQAWPSHDGSPRRQAEPLSLRGRIRHPGAGNPRTPEFSKCPTCIVYVFLGSNKSRYGIPDRTSSASELARFHLITTHTMASSPSSAESVDSGVEARPMRSGAGQAPRNRVIRLAVSSNPGRRLVPSLAFLLTWSNQPPVPVLSPTKGKATQQSRSQLTKKTSLRLLSADFILLSWIDCV